MKPLTLVALLTCLHSPPAFAGESASFASRLLTYVPNRVFDVLDLARVRVRVGPGIAAGLRATEAADVFLGSYTSVWAGLPGPRKGRGIPLPAGIESRIGIEVSVADASVGGLSGPGYGPDEIGASVHAVLLGLDLGVAPMQAVDLVLGFLLFDPAGDDF